MKGQSPNSNQKTGPSARFVLLTGAACVALVILAALAPIVWSAVKLEMAFAKAVEFSENRVGVSSARYNWPIARRVDDRRTPVACETRDIEVHLKDSAYGFCASGGRRPGQLMVSAPGETGPFAELLRGGSRAARLIGRRLPAQPEKARIALTCLLGKYGREAVPFLIGGLRDPSEDVRWAAAAALQDASSPEAAEALAGSIGGFTHAGSLVTALSSLRNTVGRSRMPPPAAAESVAPLLKHHHPSVRREAVRTLAAFGAEAVPHLKTVVLGEEWDSVRRVAVEALKKIRSAESAKSSE
jgi:hypothetical protein